MFESLIETIAGGMNLSAEQISRSSTVVLIVAFACIFRNADQRGGACRFARMVC